MKVRPQELCPFMEFACLVSKINDIFQTNIYIQLTYSNLFELIIKRLHLVIFLIHPFNYTSRFGHFTYDIVIDWLQSIHIHKELSVCVYYLRNYCKRMSLSFGHISESYKFNRKVSNLRIWLFFYSKNVFSRIRIVFKWLIRAFSGHLPPEELLILWDLVCKM